MMTRLYINSFCSILLLLPTAGWTLDEAGGAPELPVQSAPAQPIPAPALSAKPATVPQIDAKSAPAAAIQAKPIPVPVLSVKPATVPPLNAKSAPAAATLAKPATPSGAAAKPAPGTVIPPKPAPAPALPAKPGPVRPPLAQPSSAPQESLSPIDAITHTADIEVFVREGCPNCDRATEFLHKLHSLQPHLTINIRDVRKEPAALVLLKRMAQNQDGATLDYPAFVIGGHLILGFSDEANTAQQILDDLPLSHATEPTNSGTACEKGTEPGCGLIPAEPVEKPEKMLVSLFGHNIPVAQIGLPLFTVAMGVLDGLNHGSTWVLLLMVSLLAPMKNRTLMFSIAGTFIAVKGIIYFMLLIAWFNIFLVVEVSRITQMIVAAAALLAGVIYFKNYFQYGQHITLSVHEIAKPGIYTRIRKIVQSESLLAALLGTFMLSIFVQLGELTFTSVFPALYTRVLTLHHLDQLANYGYLMLYNFAYMLDDIIVLGIGIATFNNRQVTEHKGNMLLLVSAFALLGVSTYLLLAHP